MARSSIAIAEIFGRRAALFTLTDDLGLITEIHRHAIVEDVEGAFPVRFIAEAFAILNDSTINLIDLIKSALLHHCRQDFAANSTRAISDHWLIFDVIVFTALDFADEIT